MHGWDSLIQQIIVLSIGVSFSFSVELMKQNPLKMCAYLNVNRVKIRIFCSLEAFVQINQMFLFEFETACFINGTLKNCIKQKKKKRGKKSRF